MKVLNIPNLAPMLEQLHPTVRTLSKKKFLQGYSLMERLKMKLVRPIIWNSKVLVIRKRNQILMEISHIPRETLFVKHILTHPTTIGLFVLVNSK
jgi:hypothetical protein